MPSSRRLPAVSAVPIVLPEGGSRTKSAPMIREPEALGLAATTCNMKGEPGSFSRFPSPSVSHQRCSSKSPAFSAMYLISYSPSALQLPSKYIDSP